MNESLELVATAVARLPTETRLIVAIDGIDGAGKTTFADRLAESLERPALRASCDDFHRPRASRYRRGPESSLGFYLDAFDYDALTTLLLDPFRGGRRFCTRGFDHVADEPVRAQPVSAPPDAILVLDGLFLHREELRGWWDLSVLLDVPPETAAARFEQRDGTPPRERYVRAQELYFTGAAPVRHASLVVPW